MPISYVELGGGPVIRSALFDYEKGEHQGAVESAMMFIFGIDNTNNLTNNELRGEGCILCAGADNTYLIGPHK